MEDVELVQLSEAQALIAIKHCLSGQAKSLFQAALGILPGSNSLNSWSEAVQYLLQTYATDSAIEEAIEALNATSQKANEHEKAFSARFIQAEQRCGNVHRWRERKLLFIDGLNPVIKPLVARYNKQSRKATYIQVVEYAFEEGSAHRARAGSQRNTDVLLRNPTPKPSRAQPRSVNLLENYPPQSGWASHLGSQTNDGSGELHLIQPDSVDTDELPSTAEETIDATQGAEPILIANRQYRRVQPSGIPLADRQTKANRPGWIDRTQPSGYERRGSQASQASKPTGDEYCYSCYAPGHISPDCRLDLAKFALLVMRNFENLPRGISVPPTSYFKAKALLDSQSQANRLTQPSATQPQGPTSAKAPAIPPTSGEAPRGQGHP